MATKKQKKTKRKKKTTITEKIIKIVVLMFVFLFVIFSNFDKAGQVGNLLKTINLMLFGSMGIYLPILLFLYIVFVATDNNKKFRVYTLIGIYIFIICIVSLNIKNSLLLVDNDFPTYLRNELSNEMKIFSFESEKFISGIFAGFINYFLIKYIGYSGSNLLYISIIVILSLLTFNIETLKMTINIIFNIIFFIPRVVFKFLKEREEDIEVANENEKRLNELLDKRKKDSSSVLDDEESLIKKKKNEKNIVINDKNINKIKVLSKNESLRFDKIKADGKDIQSRFFKLTDKNKHDNYNHSLDDNKEIIFNKLKEKSINEIIHETKASPSDFFYTDNLPKSDKVVEDIDNNDLNMEGIKIDDYFTKDYKDTSIENVANPSSEIVNNKKQIDLKPKFEYNKKNIQKVAQEVDEKIEKIENNNFQYKKSKKYKFPPLSFLKKTGVVEGEDKNYLNNMAKTLQKTLEQFGVGAKVTNVTVGPTITRYEVMPDMGVRVKRILELQDDIKLAIAATDIRIEAPIPGKSAIGIEVPNKKTNAVYLGDIISSKEFKDSKSKLSVAVGRDISGNIIICDLQDMPHLLVAGATGSGKSVCINSIIMSIIYKSSPEDVKLIMVDPKVVELQVYNNIPHLLVPVVTDPKKAASALNWAVSEMMRRYNLIVEKQLRDIDSYNIYVDNENNRLGEDEEKLEKLPKIVIIIDEFADLMMVASKDVEDAIFRIAQLARACGIYLVIATQRPSVNVISGSIKANVPGRIAFAVSSGVDSKTIIDSYGAEKLIGKGDMLYYPTGMPKPLRVQGCFVSDQEIKNVVNFIKEPDMNYDEDIEDKINNGLQQKSSFDANNKNGNDEYFVTAGKLCIDAKTASSGFLQRKLQIGFNRASRIIDQLEEAGVVSAQDGKKPREVLLTMEEFVENFDRG